MAIVSRERPVGRPHAGMKDVRGEQIWVAFTDTEFAEVVSLNSIADPKKRQRALEHFMCSAAADFFRDAGLDPSSKVLPEGRA